MTKGINAQKVFESACKLASSGDMKSAVVLLQEAANEGHPLAQSNLGICFYYGDGVDKDLHAALSLFENAAAEDLTTANYYLGIMNLSGQSGAINVARALHHLEIAAMAGMAEAQFELGHLYEIGHPPSIKADLRKAIHWFAYAAQQGHTEANQKFEKLYYHGFETSGAATGFWFERESIENTNISADTPFRVLVTEGQYVLEDTKT